MRSKRNERNNKPRAGVVTKLLIFALLLGLSFQLYQLHGQVQMAQAEELKMEAQVESKRQENERLTEQIENGATQDRLEEIAHKKLGMVHPNEKIFYDVSN